MLITPSEQQSSGIKEIVTWYKYGCKPWFYLAGYAGTGKTTMAKLAVSACGLDPDGPDIAYAAFTGKAALVMSEKGMRDAMTIHQLIYKFEGEDDDGELVFSKSISTKLCGKSMLVMDEASMVNQEIVTDLLQICKSYGIKILVLGDPAQLNPPNGFGFFTESEPDFFLTEIHRQALDNPITRYATMVRQGEDIPFGDHGAVKRFKFEDLGMDALMGASQVLVGKNKTRHEINGLMLEEHGYPLDYPTLPGIKLICLKNKMSTGFLNGMIMWTAGVNYEADTKNAIMFQKLIKDGDSLDKRNVRGVHLIKGELQETWQKRTKDEIARDKDISNPTTSIYEKTAMPFTFGYAITVHKSQGSQYKDVTLFDDGFFTWDTQQRKQWLYTALTRAVETFTMIC